MQTLPRVDNSRVQSELSKLGLQNAGLSQSVLSTLSNISQMQSKPTMSRQEMTVMKIQENIRRYNTPCLEPHLANLWISTKESVETDMNEYATSSVFEDSLYQRSRAANNARDTSSRHLNPNCHQQLLARESRQSGSRSVDPFDISQLLRSEKAPRLSSKNQKHHLRKTTMSKDEKQTAYLRAKVAT